jgi:hypothetical protein
MASANVASTYAYLRAVASMGPFENVARFFSSDVTFPGISESDFPTRTRQPGCRHAGRI